jgi:creatinine amidohydrolase
LPRERTVVMLAVSPLEQHGPHLPVGVDAFAARHFAEAIAGRIVAARPGWNAVLAPTLHLGSFTFDAPGTIRVRQRVVRDVVIDYGTSLARSGFRYVLIANGHGGPGHLVALEEAAAIVSRRHGIVMASLTGHLMWHFLRGRYVEQIESSLGRPLSEAERRALTDDAHGGWLETSLVLLLRPDLVDPAFQDLPAARYPLVRRLVPNYPLRDGGQGYVGHPALADPVFAEAVCTVVIAEAMPLVDELLDGRGARAARHSPFARVGVFRTNFWRGVTAVGLVAAGGVSAWLAARTARRG